MKHNFKELLVWKKSIDLVKSVYLLTSTLPSEVQKMILGLKKNLENNLINYSN